MNNFKLVDCYICDACVPLYSFNGVSRESEQYGNPDMEEEERMQDFISFIPPPATVSSINQRGARSPFQLRANILEEVCQCGRQSGECTSRMFRQSFQLLFFICSLRILLGKDDHLNPD